MAEDENRSIFKIMDKIIDEVSKTKTIFTILIVLIIIPLGVLTMAFIVFDLGEADYYLEEEYVEGIDEEYVEGIDEEFEEYYEEYPNDFIYDLYLDMIFSLVIVIVIGFAIRQLIILNKWTKKYTDFKKEQEELDKKLDELDKK